MIESYNRIFIYLSSCLDESSRKFQVDTRFQLSDSTWILESNISTQLEYSSQEFWLESSLDESKTRLDLDDSTRRDQSKHKNYEICLWLSWLQIRRFQNYQDSRMMFVSWCHICLSVHWSMHVLLSVNKEFRLDHCINTSTLQKEDQIHVKKRTKENHE